MVKKYAKEVKKYSKDVLTAVGGIHAEVVPEDFECEDLDFILWANGVKTLVDLANAYPNIDVNDHLGV